MLRPYLRYLRTVIIHKYYVFLECRKVGITWRGIWHDISKFRPDEFFPYARYFEGSRSQSVVEAFDQAWRMHLERNPHHWEHWVINLPPYQLIGMVAIEMPWQFQEELVCDYRAAGLAYTGRDDSREYYLEHRNDILLDSCTRTCIEIDLGIIEGGELGEKV